MDSPRLQGNTFPLVSENLSPGPLHIPYYPRCCLPIQSKHIQIRNRKNRPSVRSAISFLCGYERCAFHLRDKSRDMCPIYRVDTVLKVRIEAFGVQNRLVYACIPSGEFDTCVRELLQYKCVKDAMNTSKQMLNAKSDLTVKMRN